VAMVLMKPLFAPQDLDGSTLPQPPVAALVVVVAAAALVDDRNDQGLTAPSAQLGKPQLSPLKA
jgi:hypothetical protein